MAEEKKGFFKRLVSGLAKTRDNIVAGFDSIFSGFSSIDEDFYEELDEGERDDLPIRVRYERYDDIDHSIIEADADGDDFY